MHSDADCNSKIPDLAVHILKKTEMYKLAFIQCLTIKYFPILKEPNAYEIRDGQQSAAAYCNAHR